MSTSTTTPSPLPGGDPETPAPAPSPPSPTPSASPIASASPATMRGGSRRGRPATSRGGAGRGGAGRGRGRGRGASTTEDDEPEAAQVPAEGPMIDFDVYVKDTFNSKDKNPYNLFVQAKDAKAFAERLEGIIFGQDWVQGFAQFHNGQWSLTDRPPINSGNPNFVYYVSIFNRSARHTFVAMPKSVVISDTMHRNWHGKRLRMCVYKWGSNVVSAKDLVDFMKACVAHGNLNPADAPVENTVQEVALRLKQARGQVYTGPTAAFRQWAVILLKEPSSQLDRLIEESDPPPNVRTRLTAVPSPETAATTRSIKLAKITIISMKKEHDDLRQFAVKLVEGTRDLHAQSVALLARIQAGDGQLVSAEAMLQAIEDPLAPFQFDQSLVAATPDASDTCHGAKPMPRTPAAPGLRTPAMTPTPSASSSAIQDEDEDEGNDDDKTDDGVTLNLRLDSESDSEDGWQEDEEEDAVSYGEHGLDPALCGVFADAE